MRINSVWLVPAEEDAQRCSDIICKLAGELKAPVFPPHLTIGSSEQHVDLEQLGSEIDPICAAPIKIETEAEFTRSLVIQFEATPPLLALRKRMEQIPGFRPGRSFDPHISLCYGPPPPGAIDRLDIAALVAGHVKFDRLVITEITLPVTSFDDVRLWREVEYFSLM